MRDMFYLAITSLGFFAVSIYLKTISLNFPKYHKEHPLSSFYGLKLNFSWINITDKNWPTIKLVISQTLFGGGIVQLLVSIGIIVSQTSGDNIISSAILIMGMCFIVILFRIRDL